MCFYVIFCASFSPCSLHPLWQPGKSAASLGFQAASSGGRNIGVVRLAKKSSTWWRGALGDDVTSLEGTSHQEGGPLNEGLERFGSDDFPIFKGGNDFQVPWCSMLVFWGVRWENMCQDQVEDNANLNRWKGTSSLSECYQNQCNPDFTRTSPTNSRTSAWGISRRHLTSSDSLKLFVARCCTNIGM